MALLNQTLIALALTFLGGGSTALGGLLVVLRPTPSLKGFSLLQGFTAGLMLSISFLDLMPEAIHSLGFAVSNIWFFSGALMFFTIANVIPEPNFETMFLAKENDDPAAKLKPKTKPAIRTKAAGSEKSIPEKRNKAIYVSGLITAIAMSLHNFPEGIAVFMGSLKGLRVGASLAIAIALHNIPEGVAISLPIYFATGKRWKSFTIALLSGLAEPLGVVFVAFFFGNSISTSVIEGCLAGVAGIMSFLSFYELIPLALEHAEKKWVIVFVFLGMATMSASLFLIKISLPSTISL